MVQATLTSSGLHIAVHDVRTQRVERVKDFPLAAVPLSPDWRQQVHAIADAIEFWVTGGRGVAATRILYSSGGRIWQIDSDGANPTALTAASPADETSGAGALPAGISCAVPGLCDVSRAPSAHSPHSPEG